MSLRHGRPVDLAVAGTYLFGQANGKGTARVRLIGHMEKASSVTLSDAAAARIAKILSDEASNKALRISVEGGGCSGFSYKYDLVETEDEEDFVIEKGAAKVVIDSLSLVYMGGSEIDFVDDLIGQSFQIRNPNAVASCGCGTSFTV